MEVIIIKACYTYICMKMSQCNNFVQLVYVNNTVLEII